MEKESSFDEMNSDVQVLKVQLNESNMEDELYREGIIQLPLSMSDKFYLQYYVMFENKSNNCWLNSALALLLQNRTLYCTLKSKSDTVLVKIMKLYRNVMVFMNDRPLDLQKLAIASKKVKFVQELALAYLQPLLKCEDGKPDSAFNAAMNLISSDAKALGLFVTSFSRNFECENCKTGKIRQHKKSVITLTAVEVFTGSNPVSICDCSVCKVPKQKMVLHYQSLPPCLLFHFENGAGEGFLEETEFRIGARTYHLSGVVTLDKSGPIPHFITWIRNPDTDRWLGYNDLGPKVSVFNESNPKINLGSIHMLSFEALDQMGVISNFGGFVPTSRMYGESCNHAEIPEITLSDDNDGDCSSQGQPNCSSTAVNVNFPCGVQNDNFETNPAQSSSRPVSNLSAPVTEMSTSATASSENFSKKEKSLLNGTSTLLHDVPSSKTNSICGALQIRCNETKKVSCQNSSKLPKKKNHDSSEEMTRSEENLFNKVVDELMLNQMFPCFGLLNN